MNNAEKAIVYGIIALAAIAATIALAVSNSKLKKKIENGEYSSNGGACVQKAGEMKYETISTWYSDCRSCCIAKDASDKCLADCRDAYNLGIAEANGQISSACGDKQMTKEDLQKERDELKSKYDALKNENISYDGKSYNAFQAFDRFTQLYVGSRYICEENVKYIDDSFNKYMKSDLTCFNNMQLLNIYSAAQDIVKNSINRKSKLTFGAFEEVDIIKFHCSYNPSTFNGDERNATPVKEAERNACINYILTGSNNPFPNVSGVQSPCNGTRVLGGGS